MNTKLKILLVEDNPGDAELIKDMISESRLESSGIEEVHTLKHAITQVQNNKFDIILLDLGLPDSAGMDTLSGMLKYARTIPIIVLTGLDDEEVGLDAISKGAQDYLVKGKVDPEMLARFVLYSKERKKDAEKIYHLNSMLKAIRNVNQLIVKEKDVDELITSSCDILTKEREYLNACIILFSEKGKPYKSSMRRDTKGYNEFRTQVEKGTWNGMCQKALETEGIQIIENPVIECRNCPLNVNSCESFTAAVRLEYDNKIYGIMSVRIPKEVGFAEQEQELLKEAAGDISFAIHYIEIEEAHKNAEEALWESEEKYRAIFENMVAACCTDEIVYENGQAIDYRIIDVNPSFEHIMNINKDDIVGTLASQAYGTGEAPFLDIYAKVAETGEPVTFEMYFEPIKKYLHVTSSCPGKGKFSNVFSDITERKQAEEQLKKELAEKEVLLREIRHRVKNNLQVISGLLHLQQREIKTKEDVVKGFNASQDRILAMAKAYELLLGSEYMSEVSVGKYIESLAAQLKNNYDIHNKITLRYSMDELTVNIEILDRLALALNEIITNAIKYAFEGRDSGIITIKVKGNEDRFTIKISDDGTGIPEQVKIDEPTTLGLSIISMIIGQLYGTLSIDRTNGTCFTLEIPQKKDELSER